MKKAVWLVVILLLVLSMQYVCVAEEDFSLDDFAETEDIVYDDVTWKFPIDIFDMDADMIVLANKTCLLSKSFVPKPLVNMKGVRKASSSTMELQKNCAEALKAMFTAAEGDGIKLYLKSAYRSYKTQKTMYYNRLEKNNGKDDGWVSKPGASDHQTGLGCDIVSYAWRSKSMNSSFSKTAEAQWMAAHCAEYGFIIRYPKGKEDIT